jgi:nucleotide-binding universal stress UspA family protein
VLARIEGAAVRRVEVPEGTAPAEGLRDEAERSGAELVVLGSTHRGMLGRVAHGTVAGHLLHGAPCGVAVAPVGYAAAAPAGLTRVVVAYDGSDESRHAVARAASIAARADAILELATVVEANRYDWTVSGATYMDASIAGTAPGYVDPGLIEADLEAARHRLEGVASSLPDEVTTETTLLEGKAASELLTISETGVDLLVLGSRGLAGPKRVFLGSTSSRVVRSASCPVWVVPAGATADSA